MKKIVVFSIVIIISVISLIFMLFAQSGANNSPTTKITEYPQTTIIKSREFGLVIADTHRERTQGLSGRENIANDEAMLFIFDQPSNHGIWMKDMLFNIDIAWLNENKQVVHIEEKVSPATYNEGIDPQIFTPSQDSLYILEFKAGVIGDLGLEVGDSVGF